MEAEDEDENCISSTRIIEKPATELERKPFKVVLAQHTKISQHARMQMSAQERPVIAQSRGQRSWNQPYRLVRTCAANISAYLNYFGF